MFSKSSNKEPEAASTTTQPAAGAVTPAAAAAAAQPKRRTAGVPSIFSAEVIVRGTIISMGDVQVDGKIEGDVRASSLVLGEKAAVIGDVYAEDATIRGRVEGGISARKVQLAATCHVSGNILHETLSVEAGAFFEGNCRHSDNPLADAPDGQNDKRSNHSGKGSAPKAADDHSRASANFAPLKN
jgi:cytoskeletal protein CcmA (bactofilin family)